MENTYTSQARIDSVIAAVADIDWKAVDVVLRAAHSVDLASWMDYDPEVHDAKRLASEAQRLGLDAVEQYIATEGDTYAISRYGIRVDVSETTVTVAVEFSLDHGTGYQSGKDAVNEYALRYVEDNDG